MATGITLLQVRAQGGGAADADVPKSLALLGREGMAPLAQELLSIAAKDLGHFQLIVFHRLRPSPSEVKTSRIGRAAKGLGVVWKRRSETYK